MAASRALFLVGLLVARLCASAGASRVAPAETTSRKLAGLLPTLNIRVSLRIVLVEILPYDQVKMTLQSAGGPAVPFDFAPVDGVVELVQDITIAVGVSNPPLILTIIIGTYSQQVEVPLGAVSALLGNFPALLGLTGPLAGLLSVLQLALGALQVLNAQGLPFANLPAVPALPRPRELDSSGFWSGPE